MKAMTFNTHTEYSFWGCVEFDTNKAAMLARNSLARQLEAQGYRVRKHSLTGQTRKYDALGVPNGTTGTVYKLDAYATDKAPSLPPNVTLIDLK